jgi:uncharacterized protein YjbI with pentapeptide repeats
VSKLPLPGGRIPIVCVTQNRPFLNHAELPLIAFFVVAPILFVILHAYTLTHFVMLAAKVGMLDAELRAQLPDAEMRDALRRQLLINIFLQLIAGPSEVCRGGLGSLLKAVAWISLVINPVLLLLLIQVQFLPYHLEWVTWVQCLAILADMILLWLTLPAVLNGRSEIKWPPLWHHPVSTPASLIPIGFAFTAATFPGERMEDWIGNRQTIPSATRFGTYRWTSVHDLLFNGKVDALTRQRKSLFSNTLVLPDFDGLEAAKIDNPKMLDSVKHTLILSGRHLEKAVFYGIDLRKADLREAKLQGAALQNAKLQGAHLRDAQLQSATLWNAQLEGAFLVGAQLQGASLDGAQLQGANFQKATLAGKNMRDTVVWRTSFEDASLTAVFVDGLKGIALSKDEFAGLKAIMMKEVPEFDREDALKCIEKLNPVEFGNEASARKILEKGHMGEAAYKKSLAGQLKSLACSEDVNTPLYRARHHR